MEYFDTHPAGDLISRICYDVDTVNATLSTDLLQIATSFLTVGGSFIMLLLLSPKLSLVFFVTVPLSVALTRFQMRRIQPLFRRRSRELGALNGFAEERMGCRQAMPGLRRGGGRPQAVRDFQRVCVPGLLRGGPGQCGPGAVGELHQQSVSCGHQRVRSPAVFAGRAAPERPGLFRALLPQILRPHPGGGGSAGRAPGQCGRGGAGAGADRPARRAGGLPGRGGERASAGGDPLRPCVVRL